MDKRIIRLRSVTAEFSSSTGAADTNTDVYSILLLDVLDHTMPYAILFTTLPAIIPTILILSITLLTTSPYSYFLSNKYCSLLPTRIAHCLTRLSLIAGAQNKS